MARPGVKADPRKWTADAAKGWLKDHDFKVGKPRREGSYMWFRQTDPGKYKEWATDKSPFDFDEADGVIVTYGIYRKNGKRVSEIQSIGFYKGQAKSRRSEMSDRAISLLGVKADNAYDFKKTIQTSSAPTIITTTEATRLIDYMVDESVLWQMVRVERMDRATKWIRFLDITKGVLRRDVCGSYEDSGQITAEGKQLTARKHKVVIPICDDVLKDNLEGPALEEHILRMVAEQINNELEVIALMANTGGHYTNVDVDSSVLHWFDGWYEQMKTGNPINPTFPHCCLDWCHFGWMMRTLATKYRKRPDLLRYFMAPDLGIDYADMLEKRQTGLGDSVIMGQTVAKWRKTPIEEIPLLPTDLPNVCGGYEDGQAGTFMFLSRPENLVLGLQTEIEYERQRDGVNSQTFHIFRVGFDALVQNVAATVLLDGLTTRTECCVPGSTY